MYYTCTYIKLFRQTGMNLTEGLHARGVSVVSIYTRMLSRAFRIIIIIKYGCERTTASQTDRQTDRQTTITTSRTTTATTRDQITILYLTRM